MNPKFKIGDRVSREQNVYNPNSKLKFGHIIKIYSNVLYYDDIKVNYPELYVVQWDDNTISKAILPHGVDKIILENNHLKNEKNNKYL